MCRFVAISSEHATLLVTLPNVNRQPRGFNSGCSMLLVISPLETETRTPYSIHHTKPYITAFQPYQTRQKSTKICQTPVGIVQKWNTVVMVLTILTPTFLILYHFNNSPMSTHFVDSLDPPHLDQWPPLPSFIPHYCRLVNQRDVTERGLGCLCWWWGPVAASFQPFFTKFSDTKYLRKNFLLHKISLEIQVPFFFFHIWYSIT